MLWLALFVLVMQDTQVTSRLEILDVDSGERTMVYEAPVRFEAPNWSRDGTYLLFNQSGRLYRFYLSSGKVEELDTGFADRCNNDHGISFDGRWIAISNNSTTHGSLIYELPVEGGTPRMVTPVGPSYWHGWSPDDKFHVFVGKRGDEWDIYRIPFGGGEEVRLTNAPGLDDGPEYTPDGKYIYFNSVRTGKMQIWRMDADGSNQVQITNDGYNDWFPHVSPDGKQVVFISYIEHVDPGSHPADKQVMLRLLDLETNKISELARFTGGQGTINVPSWSPDSKKIAFVSYSLQ